MRILYVINSLAYGGAERVVVDWSTYLQRAGHSIEVCTIYTKGPLGRHLEEQGVRVHDLGLDPGLEHNQFRRKYDLRVIGPLARLARAGDYEVVHAHLFPTSLFVAAASYFARGQPFVFSEHNVFNRRRRVPVFKLLDRAIYRRYARIVAVSEAVATALRHWLPEVAAKLAVVPNSVDPSRFAVSPAQRQAVRHALGLAPNDQVILFVGRLVRAKGVEVLLEALAHLPAKARAKCLIVGPGPLRAELEQNLDESLRRSVTFLGARSDIPDLLAAADLFVLPSRWEGLPVVVLEAMAARLPIVATRVGGIPDVLQHGVSGCLVPPDDPRSLADGIGALLSSQTARVRQADVAFQVLCARFSPDVTLRRLLGVYGSMLEVRP